MTLYYEYGEEDREYEPTRLEMRNALAKIFKKIYPSLSQDDAETLAYDIEDCDVGEAYREELTEYFKEEAFESFRDELPPDD